MRATVECLEPGGLLVCEERDLWTKTTDPNSSDYAAAVDAMQQVAAKRGLNYRPRPQLPPLARDLRLEVRSGEQYQLRYSNGKGNEFWSWSFIEARKALLSAELGLVRRREGG